MVTVKSCKTCYILVVAVLLILQTLAIAAHALPPNPVKNTRFDKQKAQETVIVFFKKLPEVEFFRLQHPERIVLDVQNAFVPQVALRKTTDGAAVKQIRIAQNKKDTVRIILDISEDTPMNTRFRRKSQIRCRRSKFW